MQEFSQKFRQFTRMRGMTQKQAASHFGVSQPTISRIYSGSARREGPAYRRVVAQLAEQDLHAGEYSRIHVASGSQSASPEQSVPDDAREAIALDNLIRALKEYIVIRGEAKS